MSDLIVFLVGCGVLLFGFGLGMWWSAKDLGGFRFSELHLHLVAGFLGTMCTIILSGIIIGWWQLSKII